MNDIAYADSHKLSPIMKYTLTHQGREYSPRFKKYIRRYINLYNACAQILFFRRFSRRPEKSSCKELDEIRTKARHGTDISDHLETLFIESLTLRPKLIVELGVRTGESTFAFERVARLCDAFLVSVDIEPQQTSSSWRKWFFVEEDDITFADHFVPWCKERGIIPQIDILFIDTNHEYHHTKQEIAKWFPFLSEKSKVLFHDANVRLLYRRRDGTIGKAYHDDRDIMRAIEEFVGARFDETKDFTDMKNSWLVRHHAICNGMTILEKIA